jgi:hypothetical protein
MCICVGSRVFLIGLYVLFACKAAVATHSLTLYTLAHLGRALRMISGSDTNAAMPPDQRQANQRSRSSTRYVGVVRSDVFPTSDNKETLAEQNGGEWTWQQRRGLAR